MLDKWHRKENHFRLAGFGGGVCSINGGSVFELLAD